MPVKEICIKSFTETCFLWIIIPQETIPIKVNRWTKGITNFLLIYSDPPPQVKQSQFTVGVSSSGFSLIYDKSLLLKQIYIYKKKNTPQNIPGEQVQCRSMSNEIQKCGCEEDTPSKSWCSFVCSCKFVHALGLSRSNVSVRENTRPKRMM